MKVLFHLGHPAHFHLFKNVIKRLIQNNHQVLNIIKKKDILEELFIESGHRYLNILPEGRKDSKLGILLGMLKRDYRIFKFCLKEKPDIIIGTSAEIGHVGRLLNIPSINVNEDDASVIYTFAKISYPFNNFILSPYVCSNLQWDRKTIKYNSYHELSYLHPNNFQASKKIAAKYVNPNSKYFIIRFARFNAHHDVGIKGIDSLLAEKIIFILKPLGKIFITSERKLEPQFERYRLQISFSDIHHVMAFCSLYIGDSQTMAAESGVLGTPFIRFNDFVGRIGYLNDLEQNYKLGFGFKPDQKKEMLEKIYELISTPNLKEIFQTRRMHMLSVKIDVSQFMTWFIENYPQSVTIMKENPAYQYKFR